MMPHPERIERPRRLHGVIPAIGIIRIAPGHRLKPIGRGRDLQPVERFQPREPGLAIGSEQRDLLEICFPPIEPRQVQFGNVGELHVAPLGVGEH